MSIGHVVTRGYGTGTFAGDINLVPTRGYVSEEPAATGTLTASDVLTETTVVGKTLIITLTGATWLDDS